MPQFFTAEEFVAFKVTCERVDEGGLTAYQVVDRFSPVKSVTLYASETEALAARDAIRVNRTVEVKSQGMNHPAVHEVIA